jgi:hypothetical protein
MMADDFSFSKKAIRYCLHEVNNSQRLSQTDIFIYVSVSLCGFQGLIAPFSIYVLVWNGTKSTITVAIF